jgi:hypothetical protein
MGRGGNDGPVEVVKGKIYLIRGQKVLLDSDLAEMYGIETKRLNEQVRRNISRFPADFMFQFDEVESSGLRSQITTLKSGRATHRKYLYFQIHLNIGFPDPLLEESCTALRAACSQEWDAFELWIEKSR